ncbi:hypothetical protein ScPMuIL_017120 [Solemya velum]
MQTRSRNRFAKLHSSSASDSSDSDSTHSYNGNHYVIPQQKRRSEQISPFSTPHRPVVQPFVDRPQTVFHSPLDESETSVVRDRAESSITASPEYEIDRSDVIGITVPPQPQFALSSDESNGTTVTPTLYVRRPARERKPPDRIIPASLASTYCLNMSSKYNLVISIASLVLVLAMCAAHHPTSCNKRYTDCVNKGRLEDDMCKKNQLLCIAEYCDDRAKRLSKRPGRGSYLAQLYMCAYKWKLPMKALDLIDDYLNMESLF